MAWHALQFLGNSAAYPNADIPPDAFAKAYQFYRENYSGRNFRSTQVADWVSEGPTNIGGRTSGFAIDPVDTSVIWLGAASVDFGNRQAGAWAECLDLHPNRLSGPRRINDRHQSTEPVGDVHRHRRDLFLRLDHPRLRLSPGAR